jgi:tripartite-type tricarboxylate transporter receptor subunit TctC
VKVLHVPYPGSPQATNDLLSGRIQAVIAPASTLLPHVQDNKIVALASTDTRRLAIAPEIPTIVESGVPGVEAGLWFGLFAPTGTSTEIVGKLSRAAVEALKSEEVLKALRPLGFEAVGNTPQAFRTYVEREAGQWAAVVNAAGLKQ